MLDGKSPLGRVYPITHLFFAFLCRFVVATIYVLWR